MTVTNILGLTSIVISTGVNLFTLTSLTTKQNVYYQRL